MVCQLPLCYKKNRKSITKVIISAEQLKEEILPLHLKGHTANPPGRLGVENALLQVSELPHSWASTAQNLPKDVHAPGADPSLRIYILAEFQCLKRFKEGWKGTWDKG